MLTPFVAETKSLYKIAQIGADGIGPEVIAAGVRVVNAAAKKLGSFSVDFTELDWSSDRYKKSGSYVPDDYIEVLKAHDAILSVDMIQSIEGGDGADGPALELLVLPMCRITSRCGAYVLPYANHTSMPTCDVPSSCLGPKAP